MNPGAPILVYDYGTYGTDNEQQRNPGNGYYRIANDTAVATYGIRDITADLDVVVPVTARCFNIGTAADATAAISAMTKQCPVDNGTTAWVDVEASKQAHAGDVVQVSLSAAALPNANFTLKAVSGGEELTVTKVNAANNTFQFTMPAGDVVLTPEYSAPSYDVNWVNAAGVTLSNIGKNQAGQRFTFNAVAKPGYVLNSITASRNGVLGTVSGNNPYTVSSDVTGLGLTVTFNTTLDKFNVNLIAASGAPSILSGNTSYTDQTVKSRIVFTVAGLPGEFDVNVGTTGGTWTFDRNDNNRATTVTVTGMTADGTITVTRPTK